MEEIRTRDQMLDTPEFGPTQTGDWLDCPTLRQFNRTWTQRGLWTPHLALGAAMSDALALYLKSPGEEGLQRSLEAAEATLEKRFDESSEWSLEGLFELVKQGLLTAASTSLKEILANETVLDTELTIGGGRIDLVTENDLAKCLVVTDHKLSLQIADRYRQTMLDETLHDWQLKDYTWRASQYYGRPVGFRRRHLIVLTPKCKTYLRTEQCNPHDTIQWLASAEIHWRRMAQDEKYPLNAQPMNEKYCIHPKYHNKCRAYDACHVYHRDETKMEALYERKEHGK